MFKKLIDFVLDKHADVIAPWVFFMGSCGITIFLAAFHGIMLFLYLAAFAAAGILMLCLFNLAVSKYRDRKYQEDTKKVDDFRSSLDFAQKHGADDLTDEQISVLIRRTRS